MRFIFNEDQGITVITAWNFENKCQVLELQLYKSSLH